jgi:hypothetical protein
MYTQTERRKATGTHESVAIKIKAAREDVCTHRKAVAQQVVNYFGESVLPSNLLCFLDDADTPDIKNQYGIANRALYGPVHDPTSLAIFPSYVTDCILMEDTISGSLELAFDNLVYLHGSTCEDEIGLTMALAHELQHAVQRTTVRKLWAVNTLIPNLSRATIRALNLTWIDIPIEREARIISKRVALRYFDSERVHEFINKRIAANVTENDVVEWQWVRELTALSSADVAAETTLLLARLKNYRSEIESLLREKKISTDPDFLDVDLGSDF